jgi:ABC-type sugar transport system ATPase subunit
MMDTILQMRHISKSFPGVKALNNVNFDLRRGEVHVLVGENGAGKSTLVKILSGIYQTESEGEIIFEDSSIKIQNILQANKLGIYIIHQELNLVPDLNIAENINLGKPFPLRKNGLIDWPRLYSSADTILHSLNLKLDTRTKVKSLNVANQQMVEIAKVLSNENPKIIIMDEPTAAISDQETEELFSQIKKLKDNNVTIVYISHRLEEIKRIGDRLTVMRDGEIVDTLPVQGTTKDTIIKLMVGREVNSQYPKRCFPRGEELLRTENLILEPRVRNISFSLYASEVLGLAGLVGAGRTELVRALFGADKGVQGQLYLKNKKIRIGSPFDAVQNGMAFLTEDRKQTGLLMNFSVARNITLANIKAISNRGFIVKEKEKNAANKYKSSLQIKTPSVSSLVENLSGGNQQKVVLGRWLFRDADIVILDEPTRGIDVGAKAEIYELINKLTEMGKAVILISSDLLEVMGMSDRIAVISEGKLVGELERSEFSQEKILEMAISELVK